MLYIFFPEKACNLLKDLSLVLKIFVIGVKFFSCSFVELNVGLELTTLRSRPEPRSRVRCSTDGTAEAHQYLFLKKKKRHLGGAWVAPLVECLPSAEVMISGFWD